MDKSFSHYFAPAESLAHREQEITFSFAGRNWRFLTDRGVFSRDKLDHGTELLLESALELITEQLSAEQSDSDNYDQLNVLDLGCGYGAVGVILKQLFPQLVITACDINERATSLNERNHQKYHQKVRTLNSDGVPQQSVDMAYGNYDWVITNPPIRAGKKVVHSFFSDSYETLKVGGRLLVVIRKQQGAASAEAKITEIFGNCDRLRSQAGYRILLATKE